MTRNLHTQVRLVYRAFRRTKGIDYTQDECLKVFKVIYPELCALKESNEEMATIPLSVPTNLLPIIQEWKPTKQLLILTTEVMHTLYDKTPRPRQEIIQFYEDILPVVMRIRKLTPTECFRLMGVSEPDIHTLTHCGVSSSNLYRLAGNSIVVDVLYHLFRKAFIEPEQDIEHGTQLSLF